MIKPRGSTALRRIAAALPSRDEARHGFIDGLLIGTMVGAAIAGSTLWRRIRASRTTPARRPPSVAAPREHS